MFRRLFERPPIPLGFNLATVVPWRSPERTLVFTAWTTGVSNPIGYPRFRALASGLGCGRCLRVCSSGVYL